MWLIAQIIVSVLLISIILLQSKGTGLGSVMGGSGTSFHSRRGMEKTLFRATIGLTIVFLVMSLLPILGIQ